MSTMAFRACLFLQFWCRGLGWRKQKASLARGIDSVSLFYVPFPPPVHVHFCNFSPDQIPLTYTLPTQVNYGCDEKKTELNLYQPKEISNMPHVIHCSPINHWSDINESVAGICRYCGLLLLLIIGLCNMNSISSSSAHTTKGIDLKVSVPLNFFP